MFNVEICEVNTSKLTILKEKEMEELLCRIQNGEHECREKFIKENLGLVLNVIKHFSNRGENVDKLFHVGCIGLIKSIDNFDLSLNVRFSTYAVPMIIGEIRRYLKNNNSIKMSRFLSDIAYKALQVRNKLVNKDNKEPTISKISKELGLPCEEVVFALDTIQDPVSLFKSIYNDGCDETYVKNQIKDTKNLDDSWFENMSIKKVMKKLNIREKLIVNLRFVNGRTQTEVADEIGISKEQVSRLEKTTLMHMRKYL